MSDDEGDQEYRLLRSGSTAPSAGAARELPAGSGVITQHLMVCVTVGLLGSFSFGYATGVVNLPQAQVQADLALSDTQWSVIVSAFAAGGAIGAQLTGPQADKYGRALLLRYNSLLFVASGALQFFADPLGTGGHPIGFWLLFLGRFLVGFCSGAATVAGPMYVQEIAPARLKGAFGTLNQMSIVIGVLVSELCGAVPALGSSSGWAWLLGLTGFVGIIQFLLSPVMSTSPVWLLSQGRMDDAERSLRRLRAPGDPGIDIEVETMRAEGAKGSGPAVTLRDVLNNSDARLGLLAVIVLQTGQQLSGINAVIYYSSTFFSSVGIAAKLGTVLVGVVNALGTVVAVCFVERAGRKSLLILSASGMIVACIGVCAFLVIGDGNPDLKSTMSALGLVAVLTFVAVFEMGMGPIPWQIGAELVPEWAVAQAMGVGAATNWTFNLVISLTFLPMQKALGNYTFIPFAVALVCTLVYTIVFVPETKGRTAEQISAEFKARARFGARGGSGPTRVVSAERSTHFDAPMPGDFDGGDAARTTSRVEMA